MSLNVPDDEKNVKLEAIDNQRNTLENSKVRLDDYGLKSRPTTILMQEMQAQQQMYVQVMQALSAILRQIQDLISTPIRNIR